MERILGSRAFRDRETLQHLLEYLVQRTLDGTADNLEGICDRRRRLWQARRLHDPQTDASVRVQIGKLRRKLEEYYLDEGVSDTLLLQLPKRHFAVSFEPRTAIQELPPEHSIRPPRRRIAWMRLAHWALTVCLAGWALFLASRTTGRGETVSPELDEIWKPFLAGSRPILVSLGTVQFYHYSNGIVREPDLDRLTDAERQPRLQELRESLHSSQPLTSDLIYTGVGQATAAFLLSKHFDRMKVPGGPGA